MQTHEVIIRQGADVVGPDGPLGKVAHVVVDEPTREISDFVLQRPDGDEWMIPASEAADTSETIITLRTPWSELITSAQPYADDDFETVSGSPALHAVVRSVTTTTAASSRNTRASGALQLREEELHVGKETQELGGVELRKEVISERQAFDVPVWHDELILERQTMDPPRQCDEPVGENRSIRVVLREEVAIIDKQPVVTEVVRAGRRTVQETQHIEANVRREVADVHTEGDVRLRQPDNLGREQ